MLQSNMWVIGWLKAWQAVTSHAQWKNPGDVKKDYLSASILENNRVVFNIKGNTYRLIVAFHYDKGRGFIRFVGTHADYDRIDARTI